MKKIYSKEMHTYHCLRPIPDKGLVHFNKINIYWYDSILVSTTFIKKHHTCRVLHRLTNICLISFYCSASKDKAKANIKVL